MKNENMYHLEVWEFKEDYKVRGEIIQKKGDKIYYIQTTSFNLATTSINDMGIALIGLKIRKMVNLEDVLNTLKRIKNKTNLEYKIQTTPDMSNKPKAYTIREWNRYEAEQLEDKIKNYRCIIN